MQDKFTVVRSSNYDVIFIDDSGFVLKKKSYCQILYYIQNAILREKVVIFANFVFNFIKLLSDLILYSKLTLVTHFYC